MNQSRDIVTAYPHIQKMELLGLPMEVFEAILHYAFVARGIKRGLRLRLVNKMFASAVMQALYTFSLLDDLFDEQYPVVSPALHVSYLAHRVTQEPANGKPILNCIKRLANDVYEMRDVDGLDVLTLEDCIHKLCRWICTGEEIRLFNRFDEIFRRESNVGEKEYNEHLFAAGILTGSLSLVRNCATQDEQLLSEFYALCNYSYKIFGFIEDLAAESGSNQVLEYILTNSDPKLFKELREELFWKAAQAGRADNARFLYEFNREEVPWVFERPFYRAGLLLRAQSTSSLDVHIFIEELHTLFPHLKGCRWQVWSEQHLGSEWEYGNGLPKAAKAGRLDTIAYLIQRGAHVQGLGIDGNDDPPIYWASRYGHVAVVEFLLQHGADPTSAMANAAEWGHIVLVRRLLDAGVTPVGALSKAGAGGYLDIVRLLLDAGVNANETIGLKNPLVGAITKEHTAMFELLLERGTLLHSEGTAEECVKRATEDGLESMLELLKNHSVDVGE